MLKPLSRSLRRKFVVPYAVYKSFFCKSSYFHSSGWLESLGRGAPTSPTGQSLPWMNYPVIRFLEKRLSSDLDLFEFGSGYSTRFYASLVRSVTSVEYDVQWCRRVAKDLPKNVHLIEQPYQHDGKYCRSISQTGRNYDVVVVDGRDRVNCVLLAMDCLTDSGVILLDDSSRQAYRRAVDEAHDRGFRSLEFEGIKPTSCKSHQTTVLYRDNNCLGI